MRGSSFRWLTPVEVLSPSEQLGQACLYRRTRLAGLSRHSSPIAQRLEPGNSLPGPISRVALLLSEEEQPRVLFLPISTVAHLLRSSPIARPPECGNSLRGAQPAHSLPQAP